MRFSNDMEKLKNLILEKEYIENILVCTGNNYHVVSGIVINFDDSYVFHFEGYSFNLDFDEIESYIILP